jgi:hypothetical protein
MYTIDGEASGGQVDELDGVSATGEHGTGVKKDVASVGRRLLVEIDSGASIDGNGERTTAGSGDTVEGELSTREHEAGCSTRHLRKHQSRHAESRHRKRQQR